MKQIKFQLKNKLPVILVPSSKSPVVSVQMWVKTGSADEPKGYEGISHFIEHLVFKGTRKYQVGEIANLVEASGGELNAYTSFDQTVFYVTISKNYADVALDVIAEMMGHPTFDPAEIDSEREVVCEEIKMGQDSPQRSASQLLFSSVFKKHAYGIPVIGYDKNVRSWPQKKIVQYFQSRYVPSNMSLIVSGDFDPKQMRQKIQQYYSDFKPYKLKKLKRQKENVQKKYSISTKQKDLAETTFQLALPAPNVKHKDVPALDILALLLGQGETSRLYANLRLEKNLVNSISAFNYNPQDSGLFAFSLKYSKQDITEIFKNLFQEIEKIKQTPPTWAELKKAIINISSEQFYSIETVDGIAQKIGSAQFYLNDTNAHEKYLKQIQKIKPIDIQKIAKKYLQIEKANISLLGPDSVASHKKVGMDAIRIWKKIQEQKHKPISGKDKKEKIPKIEFKKIKTQSANDVQSFKTDRGTEILYLPSKEIPTVSAKIIFGGGARLESASQQGLTEMLTRTLITSTKNLSEEKLLRSIEESAAGMSAFGGKNTIGFSIEYMKAFEKNVLAIADQAINEAVFKNDIFEREKSVLKNQITTRQDQPSYLCGRQFNQAMFPGHPLSFDQSGTHETLDSINHTHVEKFFEKIKTNNNMQLVVVGDTDIKHWMKLAESIEKNFARGDRQLNKFPVKPLSENQRVFMEKDKEQSHVIVGWQGLSLSDPRRYVLQIVQAVLAGQGGRLFIELRDKNSLAYSVSPIKMESLETGYFGGYIACSPDKVEKALEMFKHEFSKISENLISDEELSRAQKYLIGQHDIGLQRKSSICNLISFDHFYGNPYQESLNVADKYNQITKQDVLNLCQDLFTKHHIVSIVGRSK